MDTVVMDLKASRHVMQEPSQKRQLTHHNINFDELMDAIQSKELGRISAVQQFNLRLPCPNDSMIVGSSIEFCYDFQVYSPTIADGWSLSADGSAGNVKLVGTETGSVVREDGIQIPRYPVNSCLKELSLLLSDDPIPIHSHLTGTRSAKVPSPATQCFINDLFEKAPSPRKSMTRNTLADYTLAGRDYTAPRILTSSADALLVTEPLGCPGLTLEGHLSLNSLTQSEMQRLLPPGCELTIRAVINELANRTQLPGHAILADDDADEPKKHLLYMRFNNLSVRFDTAEISLLQAQLFNMTPIDGLSLGSAAGDNPSQRITKKPVAVYPTVTHLHKVVPINAVSADEDFVMTVSFNMSSSDRMPDMICAFVGQRNLFEGADYAEGLNGKNANALQFAISTMLNVKFSEMSSEADHKHPLSTMFNGSTTIDLSNQLNTEKLLNLYLGNNNVIDKTQSIQNYPCLARLLLDSISTSTRAKEMAVIFPPMAESETTIPYGDILLLRNRGHQFGPNGLAWSRPEQGRGILEITLQAGTFSLEPSTDVVHLIGFQAEHLVVDVLPGVPHAPPKYQVNTALSGGCEKLLNASYNH
jgi:hypothetical protein